MSTRFNIPKIYQSLKLADYAPEFGDAVISVWVNPPLARLREYGAILETEADDQTRMTQIIAWLTTIWQDVTIEEITELIDTSMDTDPGLWQWMLKSTFSLIGNHRAQAKKG